MSSICEVTFEGPSSKVSATDLCIGCGDTDWDTDWDEWATHGTNTSTTAAAPMGNGGVVGIAPKANILALKIDMSFAAIKAAMQYAIDQGADVINMSLGAFAETFTDGFNERQEGSSSTATYLNSVCDNAYNAGVIVVAAAGNEATSHKSYPACNNHVIGVGALAQNKAGELAAFTNFNSSETQEDEKNVDILAPGFVYAAGIEGSKSKHTATWHDTQGTSFSSPIVAGAAALWKEKNPNGTPAQFEAELTSSAAGIGTYKDAKVNPATYYSNSSYKNNLDANLACGRLDVGNLMSLSHDATGITISQSSANLYTSGSSVGNTSVELFANVKPSTADNQNITWTTSNSNVAKLSKSSSISGEKITISAGSVAGTSTITAKSQQGSYTATCVVTTTQYIPVTGFTLKDANGNTIHDYKKATTFGFNIWSDQLEPGTYEVTITDGSLIKAVGSLKVNNPATKPVKLLDALCKDGVLQIVGTPANNFITYKLENAFVPSSDLYTVNVVSLQYREPVYRCAPY